jgi:hypothetical protein
MALQQRPDGILTYVTGSMGSGKTSWVKSQVRAAPRLIAWDGKGIDWGPRDGCQVVNLEQLRTIVASARVNGRMRLSVRVPVTRENFAAFCRLAWVWGRLRPGAIVVDEIADVTTPAKAPQEWGEIARKGRAFGINTYVTTQRPQECDKTAQGNAMVYHCGLMADADDQAYVARRLLGGMVTAAEVAALGPLEFIERDVRERSIRRGKVSFARAMPAPREPKAQPAPKPGAQVPPAATEAAPVVRRSGLLDW